MSDQELARLAEAASRLLLQAPDESVIEALQASAGVDLDMQQARQDFYDYLCIAQSGCYLPPVAHVLAQARETKEFWHFPPARHDGGDALIAWYDVAGFNPGTLPADAILSGSNRPYDHIGVLLAFLALLLDGARSIEADQAVLAEFIDDYLQPSMPVFTYLLASCDSPYIGLLGESLTDFWGALRSAHPRSKDPTQETNSKTRLIAITPMA